MLKAPQRAGAGAARQRVMRTTGVALLARERERSAGAAGGRR